MWRAQQGLGIVVRQVQRWISSVHRHWKGGDADDRMAMSHVPSSRLRK
jgi:hypothetical protein